MNILKYSLALCLFVGQIFAAAVPARAKLTPCRKSTGDEFILTHGHPYLGGSRSPGDSVGTTGMEYQANGGCEKRIYVDDSFQVHVVWMKVPFPFTSMAQRRMEYNIRLIDGSWYGEMDVSPFTSGYGALDYTRLTPYRVVISFHFNTGTNAYYPCVRIGWDTYAAPYNGWLWPIATCANNDIIVMATDDNYGDFHHVLVTTDYGPTWMNPFNTDSCACMSPYVISSNYPGSNKVVFVETRFITDSLASGQLDNDVWFRLSTDGGITWGPHTNVTHYQPSDSIRAFCNVSAIFDHNDKLHIIWTGRKYTNGIPYDASKIFHWDEIHDTITVVSHSTGMFEGGWWGWAHPNGFGAWRLPADEPLMSVDRTTGYLYAVWCGQNDTTDYSLAGWPNGDIYLSASVDGGLNWSYWRNITNTHTPGAPAGACEDEDYISVCPFVVRDSLFITYIEDKDAGAIVQSEGDTTDNPVRMLTYPVNEQSIEKMEKRTANQDYLSVLPKPSVHIIEIKYLLTANSVMSIKVIDISGRLVKTIDEGKKNAGIHRVKVDLNTLPVGTYFVVLETPGKRFTEKLVVVK